MNMTPDEIEAERERFEAHFKHLMDFSRGVDGEYRSNPTHAGFAGWRLGTEIARAEQAQLLRKMETWDAMVDTATKQAVAKIVAEKDAEIERLRAAAAELAEIKRAWGMKGGAS